MRPSLEALDKRIVRLCRAMTATGSGALVLALGPATATMAPPAPGYLLYPRAPICIVPPIASPGISPGITSEGISANVDATVARRVAVTPNPRRPRNRGISDGAGSSWLVDGTMPESPRAESPPDGG